MTRSWFARLAVLALALAVGAAGYLGGRALARRGATEAPAAPPAAPLDARGGPGAADDGPSDDREAPAPVAARPPAGVEADGGVSVGLVVPGKASLGEPAPPFALVTPDDRTIALVDFAGRPLVLNFFATWCVPCRAEMPYLQRAHEAHQADGLAVVGIDLSEEAALVLPYVGELGLTFPIGLDRHGAVADAYRVGTLPTTYFVDATGDVATSRIGAFTTEAQLAAALRQILPATSGP